MQTSDSSGRGERVITVALASSMLLASLGTSIANIALPALSAAFDAPFARVQAVVVAYLAALTVSVLVAGRLGDRFGLRRMLLAGLVAFIAGALLGGLARSLGWLIAARAVQGAGAAFLMTLSLALMREAASKARLGRAMGLLGTVSAIGTALGPVLGGLAIPAAGWRGLFLLQVPLALVALGLAAWCLPADERPAAVSARLRSRPFGPALVAALVVNLLVAAVMMTTLVVGPLFLGRGLGLRDEAVGLLMAVGPLISILGGVPSGRVVDAWGSGRVLALGLVLLAAGAFLLAFLPALIGVAGFLCGVAVLTPGYQLFQAANNAATLADVPKASLGTVSALLGLSRNLGLMLGASAMGAVFAIGAGTPDVVRVAPSALAGGMAVTFSLAGGLILVGGAIALAVGAAKLAKPATRRTA